MAKPTIIWWALKTTNMKLSFHLLPLHTEWHKVYGEMSLDGSPSGGFFQPPSLSSSMSHALPALLPPFYSNCLLQGQSHHGLRHSPSLVPSTRLFLLLWSENMDMNECWRKSESKLSHHSATHSGGTWVHITESTQGNDCAGLSFEFARDESEAEKAGEMWTKCD